MRQKKAVFSLFLAAILLTSFITAQEPYKLPPQEVIKILDSPPPTRTSLSPRGDLLYLAESESMPSIAALSQPLLRLAGLRITPRNNSRQVMMFSSSLSLKPLKDGTTRMVDLPEGVKFTSLQWSPDGAWIAFLRHRDDGVELWAVETATGKAKPLTPAKVNAVLTSGYTWLPDSRRLLVFQVPEDRGNPPEAPAVPAGPNIQETAGKFSRVWTQQDLLRNPCDEALFDYYAGSQIIEVDATSGMSRKVGAPGIYEAVDPSPDGNRLLIHRIKRPYSYSVSAQNFPTSVEIWDRDGTPVHQIADLPLADEVPPNGVPKGPRSVAWQPLKPASLTWAEALDDGNPEKQVPHRDRIMTLAAPFKDAPQELMRVQHRYAGITWLGTAGAAFVAEFDWKKRWRTTYFIDFERPPVAPKKIFDLSAQDQYNDPGSPVMTTTPTGERVAIQDKDWIYLSGSGASASGDRPFLDKVNLKTMEKTRLFRSAEGRYETFFAFPGAKREEVIISSESKTEPPNYFFLNLKNKKRKALTDFLDPAPQLTGMKKELIKYKRDDGVDLSGTLYLPPGYKDGERLPVVVWAYPLEYNDPGTAGQVRGSPHRFTYFRGTSQLFFVTQGYAVLDNATMPVVGDPKTMNDTFVEQIVAAAKAAIDTLDARGIGDRKRVGVGGHSYGAFMTANLLANSDLFAAGIARSGAYNRTLTPFGFQSERRTLCEAPQIYIRVSPFMYADKINEPILLIHGEMDNNAGTFPLQSERLFHALRGHGATARLVMLPSESHGYSARESVLHVLAEMFDWFDKYVKYKK